MSKYHTSVLLQETIESLRPAEGTRFIDATLGGGGHTVALLAAGATVLGLDTDAEAIAYAREMLDRERFDSSRWALAQSNFRHIADAAREHGFTAVDGVLFDLGVSSSQLDRPHRGFGHRFEESLIDVRLRQDDSAAPAYEVLSIATVEELYDIFTKFGEEKRARAISDAIVRTRKVNPVRSMRDLRRIVEGAGIRGIEAIRTMSRLIQALRIAVNDEMNALHEGLEGALELTREHGRIAVISFHSLEDRIVKQTFRSADVNILTKKPIRPTREELMNNERSRSAKLRVAEKI